MTGRTAAEILSNSSGGFGSFLGPGAGEVPAGGPCTVFLLINVIELITKIEDLAISLGLSLIAFDDADNILCIRLQLGGVRLLSDCNGGSRSHV